MTAAYDWTSRVGDVWAEEWRRTDRSFADLSRHLDRAAAAAMPAGPATVVDLGCGAGGTALALAAARPDLSVLGVDASAALVAVASARVAGEGARFLHADIAADDLRALAPVGGLVSRHGVMFFDDPVAVFARLRALAVPGAPLVFTCFADRARNVHASDLLMAVTGRPAPEPPAEAPGPFAFADAERVGSLLRAAGWRVGSADAIPFDYLVGEGEDPVADAASFLSRIGPAASAMAAAVPEERARLHERLVAALTERRQGDRVVLPALAWLWQAWAEEEPR